MAIKSLASVKAGNGNISGRAPLKVSYNGSANEVIDDSQTNETSLCLESTEIPLPVTRPLKTFAFDPSLGRYLGNQMTMEVKYEKLLPGPIGKRIAVIDYDGANHVFYKPVDLDNPSLLIRGGLDPSESDPRFHQQMVYAVVSETIQHFEVALGRRIRWRTGHRDRCQGQ